MENRLAACLWSSLTPTPTHTPTLLHTLYLSYLQVVGRGGIMIVLGGWCYRCHQFPIWRQQFAQTNLLSFRIEFLLVRIVTSWRTLSTVLLLLYSCANLAENTLLGCPATQAKCGKSRLGNSFAIIVSISVNNRNSSSKLF